MGEGGVGDTQLEALLSVGNDGQRRERRQLLDRWRVRGEVEVQRLMMGLGWVHRRLGVTMRMGGDGRRD